MDKFKKVIYRLSEGDLRAALLEFIVRKEKLNFESFKKKYDMTEFDIEFNEDKECTVEFLSLNPDE